MDHGIDTPNGAFGLLACGSSGRWSVDVDESSDGTGWTLELDGPAVYLVFALRDLSVARQALNYLRQSPSRRGVLPLGHFESAGVSLHWDNEDGGRCFLIVGPQARSTLRMTLTADDTRCLAEALDQVVDDLPAG